MPRLSAAPPRTRGGFVLKYINMKNNKGVSVILIVLIIVGVLAVVGGTYYFFVKKIQKPVGCTQEAKICPDGSAVGRTSPNCEFAECPTPTPDETADWQIYKNEEYGFELKYPKEWYAYDDKSDEALGITRLAFISTLSQEQYEKLELGESYEIIQINYVKGKSLEEVLKLFNNPSYLNIYNLSTKEIKVVGNSGYQISYYRNFSVTASNKEQIVVDYIFSDRDNGGVFVFSADATCNEVKICENYAKKSAQILSALNFIGGGTTGSSIFFVVRETSGPPNSQDIAGDNRIIGAMDSIIGTSAQIYYDKNDNYLNFQNTDDGKKLLDEIQKEIGKEPRIVTTNNAYCADITLTDGKTTYCIDSEGRRDKNLICSSAQMVCVNQ